MKSSLFFAFIFLWMCLVARSQVTVDNEKAHRRYWYYRTRMINDFMKIGKEQGNSIVFSERNAIYHSDGIFSSSTGPDQIDITNQYIMALTLEYKLLSRNHQDTKETVKELFHLLWTLNRLDMEAEQFFDVIEPPTDHVSANGPLNGFMLREDMPKDYFTANNNENIFHYNYSLLENGYNSSSTNLPTTYGGFTGAFYTNAQSSDNFFSDHYSSPQPGPGGSPRVKMTLPQDKYHTILIAMMFIDKYIPSSVTYNNGEAFQDGEASIKQEARNIANRCYDYCNGPNDLWVLKLLNSSGNDVGNLPVGGSAFVYAWPLSRYACMANRNFPWNISSNNILCAGYNDPYSLTGGRASYNLMCSTPNSCFDDNAVFKAWSQAGSNSDPFTGGLGSTFPIYAVMQQNTSLNNLEWAELLRKVLHQKGALLRQMSIFGDAIDVAPCQGPYNYGNCNYGGWEWSSQDRLEHPASRGANCGSGIEGHPGTCANQTFTGAFQGNYPGVDYMLLHNLYYEYQNQLFDGNQGNVGPTPFGNVISVIYSAANNVPGLVNSAWCSIQNAFNGILNGNSSVCNPSNNSGSNLVGYRDAINLMDNRDENIWPRDIGNPFLSLSTQGTNAHFAKVAVFQNLSSIAHIYATSSPAAPQNTIPSNVVYRAGKEIVLEPGFTVDAGSTFHAYVQRYLCNGNSDALNMRKAKDSTLTIDMADYETDMINPIPIHYIESPKSDSDNNPVVTEESNSEDYIADLKSLDEEKTSEFEISPNPTSAKTTVRTNKSSNEEVFTIHVYDMKGGLVKIYENVTSEFEIDLSGHSKGVYMIRVISNLGNSVTKKISLIE